MRWHFQSTVVIRIQVTPLFRLEMAKIKGGGVTCIWKFLENSSFGCNTWGFTFTSLQYTVESLSPKLLGLTWGQSYRKERKPSLKPLEQIEFSGVTSIRRHFGEIRKFAEKQGGWLVIGGDLYSDNNGTFSMGRLVPNDSWKGKFLLATNR